MTRVSLTECAVIVMNENDEYGPDTGWQFDSGCLGFLGEVYFYDFLLRCGYSGHVTGRPKNPTNKLFWIHNDELSLNKRVEFEDIPNWINRGWERGQVRYGK